MGTDKNEELLWPIPVVQISGSWKPFILVCY
jgi:hypothetical protein